jgi:hypothetical protein
MINLRPSFGNRSRGVDDPATRVAIAGFIDRVVRWSTKNPATAQAALYRGLELFDLMLDDPQHRRSVARLREIARAREVVVDFFVGANEYGSTGPALQKYFDQFALAARLAHRAG